MASPAPAGDPAKDEMAEAMGRIVDALTGVQQNLLIYLGDKAVEELWVYFHKQQNKWRALKVERLS